MEIIKDESRYGMFDWWKKVLFENYANFEGRARRSEYWYYVLCNFIITTSLWILSFLLIFFGGFLLWFLIGLFGLATFIPNLAVVVRRLHDTGKSGWNYLFVLIPFAGPIILIVFLATEGDRGPNQYGPDPKQVFGTQLDNIGKE